VERGDVFHVDLIAHHRRLWVWRVLAGLPALLTVDALMGLAYRPKTSADVKIHVPRSGTTHRAIVVFPGCAMPGGTLGRAFAPYVEDDDAMIVVNYTERGVLGQCPSSASSRT